MKRNNHKSNFDSKVIDLAVKVDGCLQAPKNVRNQQQDSSDWKLSEEDFVDLAPEEITELKDAVQAISFLGHVREDFKRKPSRKPKSSELHQPTVQQDGNDSTFNQSALLNSITAPDATSPGASFGRFTILKSVGQGGFAKVFRALDPLLDREVALKIPKPNVVASREAQLRFQREAKVAAMLSHPSIVPVFETGNVGPISYIASAFCPGQTLADWIFTTAKSTERNPGVSTPLQSARAAGMVLELSRAIHHAHQRGLIHRDLKPANILIENGEQELAHRLRITDFGLAKKVQPDDCSLTVEGVIVGTPNYMSPEQACGSAKINESTDIYSLGVILYELLTGSVPFDRDNLLKTLKAVENESPKSPRAINPAVSADLDAICLKCLEKSPNDRYATAHDLAEDLEAWRTGKSIKARHATTTERVWRWTRRNPKLATALMFCFLSLAIGFAVSSFFWRSASWQKNLASHQKEVAEAQRDRARENISLLQLTIEDVLEQYLSLDETSVRKPGQRNIIRRLIKTHKTLLTEEAENLTDLPELIDSFTKIARLYNHVGDYSAAEEVGQFIRQLVQQAYANHPDRTDEIMLFEIKAELEMIHQAMADGRKSEARQTLDDTMRLMSKFESQSGRSIDAEMWLNAYRRHGLLLLGQHQYTNAKASFGRYRDMAIQFLAAEPNKKAIQSDVASSLQLLGVVCDEQGELVEATRYFQLALDQYNEIDSDNTRPIAAIHAKLGEINVTWKKVDAARENFRIALEILETERRKKPDDIRLLNRYVYVLKQATGLHRSQGEHKREKMLLERGLQLADDVKHGHMRLNYQLFFRTSLAKLLWRHIGDANSKQRSVVLIDQAIALGESKLKEYPNEHFLTKTLVRAYLQKATFSNANGEPKIAQRSMDVALELTVKHLKQSPDIHSQKLAVETSTKVSEFHCANHHFDRAAQTLIDLASRFPESSKVQYSTACALCTVVKLHRKTARPRFERLAIESQAFDLLKAAIDLGFDDANRLSVDQPWKSVRSAPRYHQLLRELDR